MPLSSALVALALVGAGGPSGSQADHSAPQIECVRHAAVPPSTGPQISYQLRFVRLSTIDWRGKFDARFKPVSRQGGAAVWAADAATLRDLLTFCQADTRCNIVQAPNVTVLMGDRVSLADGDKINYVAHLERVADGPVGQATKLAFKPDIDHVYNGVQADLTGSHLDADGLRTRLTVQREHVVGFETTATQTETILADPGRAGQGKTPYALRGTLQVPMVDSARVDGEWVIPKDGVLIVGLGLHPIRVKGGLISREQILEDVVVIGYRLVTDAPPESTTTVRPPMVRGPVAN